MPRRVQDIIPADRRGIRGVPTPTRKVPKLTRETVIEKPSRSKKTVVEELEGEEIVPIRGEIISRKLSKPERLDKLDAETDLGESPKEETEIPIGKVYPPVRRMPVTPPPEIKKRFKIRIGKWPVITLVVIVFIVVAGYFASTRYSQATFTIIPKVIPVKVDSTYVAKDKLQNSELPYEIITLKGGATTTVTAASGAQTSTKATGKITIYNYFTDKTVRLIAGTRVSNDAGLVYRLSSSIVVPGYTKPSGTIVPGKISVSIVADAAGQNYNMPQTDPPVELKVVAYKGVPKYDQIYAKAVGSISGGYVGVKKIVSPTVIASTTAILKSQISADLLRKADTSIPNGFITYNKTYTTAFTAPIIGGDNPKTATVSLQGTLYVFAFPKNKFVEAIVGGQTIGLFGPFSYTAPGLEDLDVTITNIKDFSLAKKTSLVLRAKGNMKVIGTIPVDEIKKKLSGISLAGTQDVFKSYSPVIESGSGELAPPWAKIPTDLSRIKVTVQEP